MKISDIAQNVKNSKSGGKLGLNLDVKKLRIPLTPVLWAGFVLVFAAELFSLYAYGYKNLVFISPESQASQAAVRVNFVNYDKVIERLNEVQSYRATSTIDFLGPDKNTGRNNPFEDPQL